MFFDQHVLNQGKKLQPEWSDFILVRPWGFSMRASENKATGERSKLPKLKKSKLQEISPMSAQETPPGTGFPVSSAIN